MDVKCSFGDPVSEKASCSLSDKPPKTRLTDLLDEVEKHVDLLRRDLLQLEEKKDTLLATLDTIRHSDLITQLSDEDATEVDMYADRLAKMCYAMDINVVTSRDQRQEEALYQVNRLIDSLVVVLRSDPRSARMRCLSYVSACSSRFGCKAIEIGEEEEELEEDPPTPTFVPDAIFEDAVFLCTPDDRKRIQRRLSGLLAYIERETSGLFPTTL